MKAVLQRVRRASVAVGDEVIGAIDRGFVVLLGIGTDDGPPEATWMAQKIANLRVFEDEEGKFNRSLLDIDGEALVVSQFTLYADCRKGRRPSFTNAGEPEQAQLLYRRVVDLVRESGIPTSEGVFQAVMEVELVNDGPVTILLDSKRNL